MTDELLSDQTVEMPPCEAIAVDLVKYPQPMELADIFLRPGPVEMEVGSGKGTFLVNQSALYPERNYLGIEWTGEFYRYALDRLIRRRRTNVRLLHTDARDFIRLYLRDESISACHVYFPDPWPKTRHRKRRFFQPDTILEVWRVLAPGSLLRVATDHEDYFAQICQVMLQDERVAGRFEEVGFSPAEAAAEGELVGTNFERKYIKEGRQFYKLAMKKR